MMKKDETYSPWTVGQIVGTSLDDLLARDRRLREYERTLAAERRFIADVYEKRQKAAIQKAHRS